MRVLAVVTAVIGVAWLAALYTQAGNRQPKSAPKKVALVSRTSDRVRYAQNHYPQLPIANGQREIVHTMLNIPKAMRFGDFVWDDSRTSTGPIWIRVDLSNQILSVFRGGDEIGSAVIVYGGKANATPTGEFDILQKDADYYSHSYDAPMPFMLRLTKDGVAIHGSPVREGWATHGCIGIPLQFARHLFAVVQKGDPVTIIPAGQALNDLRG